MILKPSLTLEDGRRALAAATMQADGLAVSIAVVDEAGALIAFARLDGARGYTAELATQKARAAASVGVSTAIIQRLQTPGQGVATSPGGHPVISGGVCAGAVGVSGAKPEIDASLAQAAAEAVSA